MNAEGYVMGKSPPYDKVEAPTETTPGLQAVLVSTAKTALQLYDGNVLYYKPCDFVDPASFGRLSILEINSHPQPVAGILGRDFIEVYGGLNRLCAKQLRTASPVHWVRSV